MIGTIPPNFAMPTKTLVAVVPCLIAIVFFCLDHIVEAQEPFPKRARQLMTRDVDAAVERGLEYLVRTQEDAGNFTGYYGKNAAVVAFAGMALLAHGDTPMPGGKASDKRPLAPETEQARRHCLTRCLEYVLSLADADGYIDAGAAGVDTSMYGHGFATLFLAEAHGMTDMPRLPQVLRGAVAVILAAQNEEGGWRYAPTPSDADVSVTVCQVMALRGARDAGFFVPADPLRRAVAYIERCQNADGGFSYQTTGEQVSLFPRSAAAVVALQAVGDKAQAARARGLEYLRATRPTVQPTGPEGHYLYGQYYAAQAWWQGDEETFLTWYVSARKELLSRQRPNGSWNDTIGPAYATALTTLMLQMPNNSLPIFRR